MSNLPFILPAGTQVVSHVDITNSAGDVTFAAGAVGIIVKSPVDATHAYRVRFIDGTEQSLKREAVSSVPQSSPAPNNAGMTIWPESICTRMSSIVVWSDHVPMDSTMKNPTSTCVESICRPPIYTGRCSASRNSWSAARKRIGRCRSSPCWR